MIISHRDYNYIDEGGGNQMLKVDGAIYDTNKVICRNISVFDASERGLLSQNILAQLRNFVEYIVHNGVMKDLSVLQESPFTDRGSIVEVFTDLSVWLSIKAVIDRINANAVA